jgi:hypothetical protein
MHKLFFGITALLAFQVHGASAATVDFDISVTCPTCSVTGGNTNVLVTTPEPTPGEYLVTGFIGSVGGFPTSIIPPGGWSNTNGKNDNILFFPANPAFFEVGGLGILVNGLQTDISCNGTACAVLYSDPSNPAVPDGLTHPITDMRVTATPLPAALPLFASGAVAIGFLGWLKKRKLASY